VMPARSGPRGISLSGPAGEGGWSCCISAMIEAFGASAVPWLAETPGFCAALLFADPDSGP
jgi:hypothetical protein